MCGPVSGPLSVERDPAHTSDPIEIAGFREWMLRDGRPAARGSAHAGDAIPIGARVGAVRETSGSVDFRGVSDHVSGVGLERSRPAFKRHSPKHCTLPARRVKGCWRMLFSPTNSGPRRRLGKSVPVVTVLGFARSAARRTRLPGDECDRPRGARTFRQTANPSSSARSSQPCALRKPSRRTP